MSSPYIDCVYIAGPSSEQAEALRQAVSLRGFDRVKRYTLDELLAQAPTLMRELPPDLVILDPQGHYNQAFSVMKTLEPGVPVIFLAETFDEEIFVTCFDAGARDFLIKPVPPAYLISRALMALEGRRLRAQLDQRNQALLDMGAIGADSNAFSPEYFIRALKRDACHADESGAPLSLIYVEARLQEEPGSDRQSWGAARHHTVGAALASCCRGGDRVGEYFEDGYLIALPGTTLEGAQTVVRRIHRRFEGASVTVGERAIACRVRAAGATYAGCRHYEELIRRATDALASQG